MTKLQGSTLTIGRIRNTHPFLKRSCNDLTKHLCKHYLIQITCEDPISLPQQPTLSHQARYTARRLPAPTSATTCFFTHAATSSHQRSKGTLIGLECPVVGSSRQTLQHLLGQSRSSKNARKHECFLIRTQHVPCFVGLENGETTTSTGTW
jgi:hypothetical protein